MGNRSGLLTAGGVLAIIAGASGIFRGIGNIADIGGTRFGGGLWGMLGFFGGIVAGIIGIAIAVLAIFGGISALNRRNFLFALLAGGVGGLISSWLLGLLALIFIAIRSQEFKTGK
ncbi:MAG: hypothetical protein NTV30_08380 [Chloroflexi bacterium]|nr:hypothetical protein [Chloroflexota bacterium]